MESFQQGLYKKDTKKKTGPAEQNMVCLVLISVQCHFLRYSKTCLKRPIKNRHNKGLEDKW